MNSITTLNDWARTAFDNPRVLTQKPPAPPRKQPTAEEIEAALFGEPPRPPIFIEDVQYKLLETNKRILASMSKSRPTPANAPSSLTTAILDVIFADELPSVFMQPDEIVEGVLVAGEGSILYGDSNSGKTFFVIDMACAVARGVQWMSRQTEQGLVIYLAAESPASVRSRLQAYQRHHNVRVPNFAIVQSPIDLFDGDADTDLLIQTIQQIELERGMRARLIIGDTLHA